MRLRLGGEGPVVGLPARWGTPHRDSEDGFVYFPGPAGQAGPAAGYRAVPCFMIAVPAIRDQRIRVAGYLAELPPP